MLVVMQLWNEIQLVAVGRYLASFTIPIYEVKGSRLGTKGSALALELGKRDFLVTAGHVARDIRDAPRGSRQLGPTALANSSRSELRIWSTGLDEYDLGLIELRSAALRDHLRAHFDFVDPSCAMHLQDWNEAFVVVGFPSVENQSDGVPPTPRALKCFSEPFTGNPADDAPAFHPDGEFLLRYDETLTNVAGDMHVEAPDLHGVSGGPIWALLREDVDDTIWAPKKDLRWVGVETACTPGKYIRGTKLSMLRQLLNQSVDESLATAFQDCLNTFPVPGKLGIPGRSS